MRLRRVATMEQRFWRLASRGPVTACWKWAGACSQFGYGLTSRFTIDAGGKRAWSNAFAHRVSWEIHNGQIPAGMQVCHRCDNPPCVNPGHLFLGTSQDNMTDKMLKGRHRTAAGEDVPHHKLTWAAVAEARLRRLDGALLKDLARDYGVTQSTMSVALNGHTWRAEKAERARRTDRG